MSKEEILKYAAEAIESRYRKSRMFQLITRMVVCLYMSAPAALHPMT